MDDRDIGPHGIAVAASIIHWPIDTRGELPKLAYAAEVVGVEYKYRMLVRIALLGVARVGSGSIITCISDSCAAIPELFFCANYF